MEADAREPREEGKDLNEQAPQEKPVLEPKRGLAEEIKAEHGEDVYRCYQCQKCSAGCPMTFAMDYPPSQIMRMIQLGQEEDLLASKTIWACVTCNTCSIRCPNDIDIALVIDSLRERVLQKGKTPAVENVAMFHRYFLDNVRKRGRTFEGELLARYQLKTGQAVGNAALGLRMFLKGRIGLLPESVSNKKAFREIYSRVEKRGGHK
jgi:heterodisulfide reductase subunit C